MKKYFIVVMLLVGSLAAHSQLTGGGKEANKAEPSAAAPQKSTYSVLNSGFFVDLLPGFGFEHFSYRGYDYYNYDRVDLNMGGLAVRIGSKWLFGSSKRFRAGFQMTWVRFGLYSGRYKNYYDYDYGYEERFVVVQLAPVNLGFTSILAFNDNMGIEFNYVIGFNVVAGSYMETVALGFLHNPNVKFRLNRFSFGIDLTYGSFGLIDYEDIKFNHNSFSFIVGAKF